MLNRHSIKYIYKQRDSKIKCSIIVKNLRSIYKENASAKEIYSVIYSIKISDYNDYWINKLLEKFYLSKCHIDKIIAYINNRYNIKLTRQAAYVRLNRRNVTRPNQVTNRIKVTKKQENDICNKYLNGKSSVALAKEYGFKKHKSILDILKEHNIERRVNEDYLVRNEFNFIKIDSKFKAYYLGILLTDGYLNSKRNNVSVQMADKDVIEFIAANTNSTYIEIKKKNPNCKLMYRTSIYNPEYEIQLKRLGVIKNKSLILEGPKLYNDEYRFIKYILRGIIDGDGWIRKDGKEFFISSASEIFINWCKTQLLNIGMKDLKVKYISNEYNGIYILRTAIKENIDILKKDIYNESFGMNRKYNILN